MNLKSNHATNKMEKRGGINVFTGAIENMVDNDVLEPLRLKIQGIDSATDVATMILRIDDVIAARKGAGGPPPGAGGMGGMPPGMM